MLEVEVAGLVPEEQQHTAYVLRQPRGGVLEDGQEYGGDQEAQLTLPDGGQEGHQHVVASRSHSISGRNGLHMVSPLNTKLSV